MSRSVIIIILNSLVSNDTFAKELSQSFLLQSSEVWVIRRIVDFVIHFSEGTSTV